MKAVAAILPPSRPPPNPALHRTRLADRLFEAWGSSSGPGR